MTLTVLLAAGDGVFEDYDAPLRAAIAKQGLDAQLVTDAPAQTVDYIVYAPSSPLQDFTPFTNCRAVLSLWAGVERIVGNATLTQPLARMVDPSLTQGMVEYVVGHVLRYHLALDKPATSWTPVVPPLAQDRCVGFLGLGELGRACAGALRALGFDVAGWSRSPRQLEGIACHSGTEGLRAVLARSDILVTLLPDTPATTNILNATTLAHLPRGARIINPGRGTAIDDAALLAALDQGQIAAATLDVFRTEPLPENHPFWHHPNVTVTPHIAAATRTETACDVIAANIARVERGQPLLHGVSRHNGY